MKRAIATGTVAALAVAAACSQPPSDARVIETAPDRASFAPVAQMMVHSCGTLDCHGQVGRNLKIYGNTGLRYAPTDTPSALTSTTNDEVDRDYESLIGLEPEIMTAVVTSGGANPERLTFIRKGRGAEEHKGGTLVKVGDDQDVCMTSWLAGSTDTAACGRALKLP